MILFNVVINSATKTITLSVTDADGNAQVDVCVLLPGQTDYIKMATITVASSAIQEFYYSSGWNITGPEDQIFPDGVYRFKVVPFEDDPDDNDEIEYLYTDAQVRCCLASHISKIVNYDCTDCKRDQKMKELFFLKLLLEGARHDGSSSCGDWTEANAKLNYVSEFCSNGESDCLKKGCN